MAEASWPFSAGDGKEEATKLELDSVFLSRKCHA